MVVELAGNLTSQELTGITELLSPFLKIIGGIAGLYIVYLIIRIIYERINAKRIKQINNNTELIISKLNKIEKKLKI